MPAIAPNLVKVLCEGYQAQLPTLRPAPTTHVHITTPASLAHYWSELMACQQLAIDLETYPPDVALDPHRGHARLISLAWRRPTGTSFAVIADVTQIDLQAIKPLLESPTITKLAHNATFEHQFLLAQGIEAGPWWDSMIAAQLLEGGRHLKEPGYFTLAALTQRYVDRPLDKRLQASDWGQPFLSDAQLQYAADDALVLLDLHRIVTPRLEAEGLGGTMALEMAALPALAWMGYNGAPFDAARWQQLAEAALTRQRTLANAIQGTLARELEGKNGYLPGLAPRLNLDSPVQVLTALRTLGVSLTSTDDDHLRAVQDRHPLIPQLVAYRETAKQASTYGVSILQQVHPVTSRLHPTYYQIGAASGRIISSKPNLQNIPRSPACRACICAGPGRVLVKADLSMIELCVAADLAHDAKLLRALAQRQDPYRLTASTLFRVPPDAVTPAQRAFGKTLVLGMMYGMGVSGLQAQARQQGMALSPEEAKQFLARFAEAWPALARYRQRQMSSRAMAVRSASGRVRYLAADSPGTVRVNTPVQATAADGFKAALALLWQERQCFPDAQPILAVHDELVVECEASNGEAVAAWVASCLTRGMRRYVQHAEIRVKTAIGVDWSAAEDSA